MAQATCTREGADGEEEDVAMKDLLLFYLLMSSDSYPKKECDRGRRVECPSLRIGMVRESLSDVIDMIIGFAKEGCHVMIIDVIVDGIALTPGFDQSPIS